MHLPDRIAAQGLVVTSKPDPVDRLEEVKLESLLFVRSVGTVFLGKMGPFRLPLSMLFELREKSRSAFRHAMKGED